MCNAYIDSSKGSKTASELEKALVKVGLPPKEAKIYTHLAENGEKKASEISMAIRIPKKNTYLLLASLHNRGLITATFLHPMRFRAVPVNSAFRFLMNGITRPFRHYSSCHLTNQLNEQRAYACVNCGNPYQAFPPDDQHTIATDKICDKGDSRTVRYECPNCYYRNELHWDLEPCRSYEVW